MANFIERQTAWLLVQLTKVLLWLAGWVFYAAEHIYGEEIDLED